MDKKDFNKEYFLIIIFFIVATLRLIVADILIFSGISLSNINLSGYLFWFSIVLMLLYLVFKKNKIVRIAIWGRIKLFYIIIFIQILSGLFTVYQGIIAF